MDREDALNWISSRYPASGRERQAGVNRAAELARSVKLVKPKRTRSASARESAPAAFRIVEQAETPFERGALLLAVLLYPRIGAIAATLAVHSGASLSAAYGLKGAMEVAFFGELGEALKAMRVAPFEGNYADEVDWIDLDRLADVNWAHLSTVTGEPVDVPAWQVEIRTRQETIDA
ncbi:hypothetical protein JNW90_23695 [Micromonospora sp. STR1s_5]|nr:hypothetical protein [Micromonospora sp. STR1s_5]